jgi:putative hydrolase of the HAD superfamily
MAFTTIFFDLDDTLYDRQNGLWNAIRDRMSLYMHLRLGIPEEQVPQIRRHYFEIYGTTLRGLQIHYQVNADDYLAFVHDLPLAQYLHLDPILKEITQSLSQSKWIFTNADNNHAQRVLKVLGLEDCFHGIIDVRAMDFHCKPEFEAFQKAMTIADETEPGNCLFVDDSLANLLPAHQLGLGTVLVSNNGSHQDIDYVISSIHELPSVLPMLWEK